ncbi:uncharacterized protein LOC117189130 [Drosophila miranda]|uniref:uncharacterized protein LOC117189130 n=1 Tax=Drosophila miranda TaxID=7229 RepID=UPI00143FAD4D|nr:uncharacterized protein LOC117189130 [Drosophila miranda]
MPNPDDADRQSCGRQQYLCLAFPQYLPASPRWSRITPTFTEMDTQLKAEILPDSPEQKALFKERKRVELQLQNLDRKTLKNENEENRQQYLCLTFAQHQPASPRWSRITPTLKCFT